MRRVPVKLQMSTTECGAACLAMVLSWYGHHTNISELRPLMGIGRDGADASSIISSARKFGLDGRAYSADLDYLYSVKYPIILYWKFSHFVVFERISRKGCTIVDPAGGRKTVSISELSTSFTGVLIEFHKSDKFVKKRRKISITSKKFIKSIFRASPLLIIAIIIFTLTSQGVALVPALLTKIAIDSASNLNKNLFIIVSLGFAVTASSIILTTFSRGILINLLQRSVDKKLLTDFFSHLLSLPYSYFQQRSSGDLLLRISSHTVIREVISGQFVSLLVDGLFVFVMIIYLFFISKLFALITLAMATFQVSGILIFFRLSKEYNQRDLQQQAETQSYSVGLINGIETIKSMGAENYSFKKWSEYFDRQLDTSLSTSNLETFLETFLSSFRVCTPLVIMLIGVTQVNQGIMTIGTLLAINSLMGSMLNPLAGLLGSANQIRIVITHLERIKDVLEEKPEENAAHSVELRSPVCGRIEIENMSFGYHKNSPILTDINLSVEPGKSLALVGKTGSGKSTLGRLILGLYDYDSGRILIDGNDLKKYNKKELRKICGVVTQNPIVFGGTIRDNITFGFEDCGLDDVMNASYLAQIHDEIIQMPMGYETVVDEKGSGLSGGQLQRISIARALLRKPKIILFDEATSNLDAETEKRISDAIKDMNCTRIIIAHRLNTIVEADSIAFLSDGKVKAKGSHQYLLDNCKQYSELVDLQATSTDSLE